MRKRILIIEDNDSFDEILKITFEKQYEIIITESAEEAFELIFFFGETYDLIITNIVLPDLTGLNFIKKAREINHWIPIIIIASSSSQEIAEEALNLFISGYFKKPLNLFQLQARVNNILQGQGSISYYPPLNLLSDLSGLSKFHPITINSLKEMHKNFQGKLSLGEISSSVGISMFHLCRIFKKDCNMSIKMYVNRLRLEIAKKLLKDTRYSISSIIELSGFRNRNYFFKYFYTSIGITPKQFRNNLIIKDKKKLSHHTLKPCVGLGIAALLIFGKIALFPSFHIV